MMEFLSKHSYSLVNIHKTMEKTQFLMGKSWISMAISNSYVSLPEGTESLGHQKDIRRSGQKDTRGARGILQDPVVLVPEGTVEMWEQLLADEKGCADVELEVRP